jgi:hypothetical protein
VTRHRGDAELGLLHLSVPVAPALSRVAAEAFAAFGGDTLRKIALTIG